MSYLKFLRYVDLEVQLDKTCSEMWGIKDKMSEMLDKIGEEREQTGIVKEKCGKKVKRQTILKKKLVLKEQPRKELSEKVLYY